ncbi:MAG: DUF922 domain-containing protein, partial [Myxococcota bacterium]
MFWLLACVTTPAPVVQEGPVGFPVDPAFTGRVAFEGAEVVYYELTGADDIAVFADLRAKGPRHGGAEHGATTTWKVDWTWPDGGTCAPVTVMSTIVVTFPHWEPPADAPAHAVGNWQRYVKALAVHEQGHVDRVRGVVAQIPGVLESAGCAGIEAKGAEALALLDE